MTKKRLIGILTASVFTAMISTATVVSVASPAYSAPVVTTVEGWNADGSTIRVKSGETVRVWFKDNDIRGPWTREKVETTDSLEVLTGTPSETGRMVDAQHRGGGIPNTTADDFYVSGQGVLKVTYSYSGASSQKKLVTITVRVD